MLQLLYHESDDSAYVNDLFPYTFGRFTQMRSWIESKPNYGQRYVYRCWNPLQNLWNVPKTTTYSDLGFMFKQDNGIVVPLILDFEHLSDQQIMDIVSNYVLDENQYERLLDYCTHLTQPLPIQDVPQCRSCKPDTTLIDYDPDYHTTRIPISKAQLINQNRKVGEPAPKGLPAEMAKTTGQSILDMYTRMDTMQWQDFNDSITEDGLRTHFVSIQGEVARTNQVRQDALTVARKKVADFIESTPHSLFLDSIKPFGHTWDSWKQLELADLARLEQYIDQSCKGRNEWVKQLTAQLED